ncbi:MAG: nucleotidyltransferase domain-containing protein [Cyanobacteria bacterium P01_H01_bin.153]
MDRELAQQRQQWECDRQALVPVAQTWLKQHAHQFGLEQGYLFGSVTQANKFSAHSDVDIAVETFKQGDPVGLVGYLLLHIDREVDIVLLDQCHFAGKIRRTGIEWNTKRKSPGVSTPEKDGESNE